MINKDFTDAGYSFELLTVAEVANRLKLKDNDSTVTWLKAQDISIHKLPKRVVYKIEVDCALAKPLLIDIKRKYPNDWNSIFKGVCSNNTLYEMVVAQVGQSAPLKPTTKVLPKNKKEKDLLKRLSQ